MRIIIDINGIEQPTGLGNYIRLLVKNILELDRENFYFLYTHGWSPPRPPELFLPDSGRYRFVSRRFPESLGLYAEYRLGIKVTEALIAGLKADVFHGPGNIVPPLRKTRSVLTLHHYIGTDQPFFPQNLRRRDLFYYRCMEDSVRAAGHVLCDSAHTLRDVTGLLGRLPGSASVSYPGGPGPEFKPLDSDRPDLRRKYGLPEKYVLFPGPVSERKNLPRLLEAVKAAGKTFSASLVVTGIAPGYYPEVLRGMIRSLGIEDRVLICGAADKEDMPALYGMASALVYPSLFEGFGYPVLEAFLCGCPVTASKATSVPEIAGDAALLFDPENVEEMAGCLARITSDPELRARLRERGLKRAGMFSWKNHVAEVLAAYKKVARER